ncbi:hypothetical protein ARALYDRAFT_340580 [Arabidopsis lyrata subsp. lyrata]|uniref:F-box domain-containing protein n=1 Tax=Arabidopsis lyrata subsp. lyrata TaxID=81972 RepID=D7L232_ARALL|nr:hypothetical protein ARALYDRAFT_340580 [Arabidopsis lyrata subsp. lyrata]
MAILNLPRDLIEEIVSRVPLKYMRAVRLTCKTLNALSQSSSFMKLHIGKEAAAIKEGETRMIMLMDCNLYLISVFFKGVDIDPYTEHKDYFCGIPERQILCYEIYDFDSVLWTTLDVTPHWRIVPFGNRSVFLEGNTYYCASERNSEVDGHHGHKDHIICFDYTKERFGPLLPLPFSAGYDDYVTLSCVREEKLAALLTHNEVNLYEFDIWITTKIDAEKISWNKFLTVDSQPDIPNICGVSSLMRRRKSSWVYENLTAEIVGHMCAFMIQVQCKSNLLQETRSVPSIR